MSQASSAERGALVTMVGIINAAGNHIPPVYVFPRKRVHPSFTQGALLGSCALLANSGWMNSEIFPDVLRHIKKYSLCSKENPILLLLDNHVSHCGLDSILFCRDNGIVLLSFPPHSSHKLQPLDVAIYGPFKKFCRVSFNQFIINNPGKIIGIYDVAALTKEPFLKSFNAEAITKSFACTGIYPLNELIFQASDFLDSSDTREEQIEIIETPPEVNVPAPTPEPRNKTPPPMTVGANITPEVIRPLPRIPKKITDFKNKGLSRIYTDTPEKDRIEAMSKKIKTTLVGKKYKQIQKKIKRAPIKRKRKIMTSSSSEDSDNFSVRESVLSVNLSDDSNDANTVTLSENVSPNVNDFVLVKFIDKKTFYFIGIIIGVVDETTFTIRYLRRKHQSNCFYEPLIEDVSPVLKTDIVSKLPHPTHPQGTSRSITNYMFEINFAGLDIR